MNEKIILEYTDKYKKQDKALKKLSDAHKKLVYNIYPKLRKGETVGELVSINKDEKSETYNLRLPTNSLFVKIYGEVKLNYTVYREKNVIRLEYLEPEDVLLEAYITDKKQKKKQTLDLVELLKTGKVDLIDKKGRKIDLFK